MYVIPDKKFIYMAAPRTASKSVSQTLLKKGAILVGSHHTTLDDHPEIKVSSDWVICSSIRNHWDSIISWWFKLERKQQAMTPLAEFIPRFCENNPNFVFDGQLWWKTLPLTNTLIRYEWLQADFDQALVKAGMAPCDLPHITDSARECAPYQRFYKGHTAQWVEAFFAEEIDKCGYKF